MYISAQNGGLVPLTLLVLSAHNGSVVFSSAGLAAGCDVATARNWEAPTRRARAKPSFAGSSGAVAHSNATNATLCTALPAPRRPRAPARRRTSCGRVPGLEPARGLLRLLPSLSSRCALSPSFPSLLLPHCQFMPSSSSTQATSSCTCGVRWRRRSVFSTCSLTVMCSMLRGWRETPAPLEGKVY